MALTIFARMSCVFAVALFFGCASIDSKVYSPGQLKEVKAWLLEFAYEAGALEQLQKSSGDSEVKVVSKGQMPRDLQLRDDLFFELKDEHSVSMVRKSSEATGRIQIHPIHFYSGGFKLLTVTLVNMSGETIARVKIANGDRNATFKDDDEFTRYAAKTIANVIKQK